MHVIAYTCKQPPQAVISMAGYGLTIKRLQAAWLRNLYGGLQLRETTAAYGGLRRWLRGLLHPYDVDSIVNFSANVDPLLPPVSVFNVPIA